jgi:hypothetical protein
VETGGKSMALTLLDQAKLCVDPLQKGIIEEYPRTSEVLQRLPFMSVSSDTYRYNREEILPGVGFRGVNESYNESTGILNPQIETLMISGGFSDVDRALIKTQGNVNDLRAIYDGLKAKALSLFWTKEFFKGDTTVNPRGFDGLEKRLTGPQLLDMGSSAGGDTLTLAMLDELIDCCPWGVDCLFINRTMRRKVNALIRASGAAIETVSDAFGQQIPSYASIPIGIIWIDEKGNEILDFNEPAPGDGATVTTSIYAVKFGAGQYVSGLQVSPIEVLDLGLYAGGIKFRTLIEWISGMAVFNSRAAARLRGIKNA